jgi:uncharacterized protein YndB with AHSA1/START domain
MTMNNLATFDDQLTMRHVREYPHPIDRVWDAVTMTEHLDVWLLPATQVEPRLGGKCSFSWGGPVKDSMPAEVTLFDPPRRVRYSDHDGYIEFVLEDLGGRTRLTFLQHIAAGTGLDPSDWPGGDQPAGPDTPWKPGFVAGFHGFLDQLDVYLSGRWTREQAKPAIDTVYANGDIMKLWEERPESRSPANDPANHEPLIETYREHIKKTYPR